jgi:hypothetical protein
VIVAKAKAEVIEDKPKTHREDPLRSIKETAVQLGMTIQAVDLWVKPDAMGRRRLKSVQLPSGRRKVRQSVIDQILAGTGQNGDATENIEYEDSE